MSIYHECLGNSVVFRDEDPPTTDMDDLVRAEKDVWIALQDVLRLSNKLYDKSLDLSASIKELSPDGDDSQSPSATPDSESPRAAASPWAPKDSAGADPEDRPAKLRRMQDFSFAVNQVLDMPLRDQQLLLQTKSTKHRLDKQNKMLATARQYLAAQVIIKDTNLKF